MTAPSLLQLLYGRVLPPFFSLDQRITTTEKWHVWRFVVYSPSALAFGNHPFPLMFRPLYLAYFWCNIEPQGIGKLWILWILNFIDMM